MLVFWKMAVESIKKAIRSGDLEALAEHKLQEMNVEIDRGLGSDEFTPLHWACYYGQAEVLQQFLDLGADLCVRTKQGWNGAHVCAIRGCTTCLKVLCHNGIDLTAVDARGYTCVHLAAAHGKCSALKAILKTGIDISTVDKKDWTVTHHAAFHGRLGVLQCIADMKGDLSSHDIDGNTPTHLAASEGHLDCVKFLVENNPSQSQKDVISQRNNKGATPKDLASQFERKDCVHFLSSLEDGDNTDEYPVHTAVEKGDLARLKKLIQNGSHSVHDKDEQGDTPAHKAAAGGECLCLQWLIDHGADVSLKNNDGETPRSLAIRYARVGCISILAANGYGVEYSEGEEEDGEQHSPQMLASAQEKLKELQELLDTAKDRFCQLGGELPLEDKASRSGADQKQQVSELQKKLEHERERREALESELDQMRKKLHAHQKLSRNKSSPTHSPTTEEERERIKRLKRRLSKKKYSTGGAFIRIDHI